MEAGPGSKHKNMILFVYFLQIIINFIGCQNMIVARILGKRGLPMNGNNSYTWCNSLMNKKWQNRRTAFHAQVALNIHDDNKSGNNLKLSYCIMKTSITSFQLVVTSRMGILKIRLNQKATCVMSFSAYVHTGPKLAKTLNGLIMIYYMNSTVIGL